MSALSSTPEHLKSMHQVSVKVQPFSDSFLLWKLKCLLYHFAFALQTHKGIKALN